MNRLLHRHPSHLFTLRVWVEDLDQGRWEWRGKVQHVTSGETYYFRTWAGLIARLTTMLKEEDSMSSSIKTSGVHHATLTVSDVARSKQFYTELIGLQYVTDFGPRAILSDGSFLLVLTPPPDASQALPNDRFDENRLGLDHLSLSVASRADLEAALRLFDEKGVAHGEIKELAPFGIMVLAFRDPDNIQVELTAPLA